MAEAQNNDLILGQILGKVDGMNNAINSISGTFAAHALSDKESFEQLRRQMTEDKKDADTKREEDRERDETARIFFAKVTGGLILLSAAASYLIPYLLGKL